MPTTLAVLARWGLMPFAVVDADLRVRGIANLRVVDASVFPSITNGNINAPTMMLAERAADLIKNRGTLPPVDLPWYTDPDWETRQRPNSGADQTPLKSPLL